MPERAQTGEGLPGGPILTAEQAGHLERRYSKDGVPLTPGDPIAPCATAPGHRLSYPVPRGTAPTRRSPPPPALQSMARIGADRRGARRAAPPRDKERGRLSWILSRRNSRRPANNDPVAQHRQSSQPAPTAGAVRRGARRAAPTRDKDCGRLSPIALCAPPWIGAPAVVASARVGAIFAVPRGTKRLLRPSTGAASPIRK